MFRNMVVTLDGSELSKKAMEAAIQLAAEQKSVLYFLHVVKEVVVPPYVMGEMAYSNRDYDTELNNILYKEGEELLRRAKEQAKEKGVTSRIVMLKGDPAVEIIDFIKDHDIQLVVMGSRGLGAFKEMMLGSVSHKVAQIAPCPVMIVK
ncbi:MAG TPA: universal stress protein [Paenibacillaceae bacterium]|nr:universal stress protein [Paenibacillaceae bacterium]